MTDVLEWVSPQKFANIMGVDKKAVLYAIESGRITDAVKRLPNGFRQIHIEQGKALWKKNTKPNNMSILSKRGIDTEGDPADLPEEDAESLHAAKRRREFALAQIAEIELAERQGKLIDIDQVRKVGFEAARIARDALINIPNRISDELASLTTRDAVHELLTREIYEALSSLEKLQNVSVTE